MFPDAMPLEDLRWKKAFGETRRRREDNIKMDLKEVVCDARNWMDLAQDRNQWLAHVRAVMNLQLP